MNDSTTSSEFHGSTSIIGAKTSYNRPELNQLEQDKENGKSPGKETPSTSHNHLFIFSNAKAGMNDINYEDKARQLEIIYNMSKDSEYFKRMQERDEKNTLRVQNMKNSIMSLNHNEICELMAKVSKRLLDLEGKRNLHNICCVLDMDMFFAAVEIRDQPHLKDKPVAVGGMSMIGTSNYVARKYGVRAAMPGFIAKKLCPDLIFLPHNFEKYTAVSKQMRELISEYDPNYISWSLDEVYFDLTKASRSRILHRHAISEIEANDHSMNISTEELRKEAFEILQEIRSRICTITNGLTCSAGMANNFYLAKICADINKPNGQYELPPNRNDIISFLDTLPTRKVGGIGKVMEKTLSDLDIKTMGDVRLNAYKLLHVMTDQTMSYLLRSSIGISEEESLGNSDKVSVDKEFALDRKSLGAERTFNAISSSHDLENKLHEICELVAIELTKEQLQGKCITLKLKSAKFELFTRSFSCPHPVHKAEDIERYSLVMLHRMMPIEIRLMGITMTKLEKIGLKDHLLVKYGYVKSSRDERQSDEGVKQIHVSTEYSCPKCDRGHRTLLDLNVHLDLCLGSSSVTEIPSSTSSSSSSSSTLIISASNSISPIVEGNYMSFDDMDSDSLQCPICMRRLGNINLLNIHVDSCLDSNNHDHSSRGSHTAPTKRFRGKDKYEKASSIENYFQKRK